MSSATDPTAITPSAMLVELISMANSLVQRTYELASDAVATTLQALGLLEPLAQSAEIDLEAFHAEVQQYQEELSETRSELDAANVQLTFTAAALEQKELVARDLQEKLKAKSGISYEQLRSETAKMRLQLTALSLTTAPAALTRFSVSCLQVARREHKLEVAAAVAASTKVKLKVAAETRAFFETLMQEDPPAEQRFLRLLIENQVRQLRPCPHLHLLFPRPHLGLDLHSP